ncbi:MAG: N-acyl-D-glucosamine 2-epimerase [Sphingobacteriaceae bacterium]|nr:MAG: N-acyl-D-glucosamine 2-epimerase [Sphingobacteriaceae bacterium]
MNYNLKHEFEAELQNILDFWSTVAVDNVNGGFYGSIDNDNQPDESALKGLVLNARILWSFAAAYNLNGDASYLETARTSYAYIIKHFIDEEHGGAYWSVNANGLPADTKKQIYAIAFAIYALAEYYQAVPNEKVIELAKGLFNDIEKHSFDNKRGGYLEAFTRNWQPIADLRLSDKDANEKKTMNTHLHILEAYTNLYRIWPDGFLKDQIIGLIENFTQHIVNKNTHHLDLFFDEDWQVRSNIISYGHDIEASWLLLEAAEVIHDEELISQIKELSVKMAEASVEGIEPNGAMNYEYEADKNHLIAEKHWWVQAEALVGLLNAYELSGQHRFYDDFLNVWGYIKQHIINHKNGEWFWGINPDGSIMQGEDKAGFWKCPYHNSRACMEVIKRLDKLS